MLTDPLFQPLAGAAPRATVRIHFDGRVLSVPAGSSVAAALLQSGVREFRHSPVGGGARAPYCMMGVCFDCLVTIDGEPSRQACLVAVRDGMKVSPQNGLPSFDAPAITPAPMEAPHEA
jgi:predicted molibdopterin-dependent oxidoreductase YjgC